MTPRLSPEIRSLLPLSGAAFLISALLAILAEGVAGDEEVSHYQIARYAFQYPEQSLSVQGRPLATLVLSLPAQLGFLGARLASALATGLTALVVARVAQKAGWSPVAAFVLAQVPAYGIVIALEWLCPFRSDWSRSHRDVWVDVRHMLTITLFGGLFDTVLRAGALVVLAWLSGHFGLTLWPGSWPLAAQLGLALVIGELGQYWVHRLQHENEWLWRIHALHHSAPRLYWLNAARFHPLDVGLNALASNFVFGTCFLPADREPPSDIGLADLPHFPMTYLAQLASPFRWSFIKRSAV